LIEGTQWVLAEKGRLEGEAKGLGDQLAKAKADYDALARRWIQEVVLRRRHRTTKRIVGYAWADERPLLRAIPERLLAKYTANLSVLPLAVVNNEQRQLGEVVQIRLLSDYEEATQ
jgi:hypothetical protein